MKSFTPLSFLLFVALLVLFPLLFSQLMVASLTKLHLGRDVAGALVVGIILGGLVNIPVTRSTRRHDMVLRPLAVYGLPDAWPRFAQSQPQSTIALNLGGCVIPTGLALYELVQLGAGGLGAAGLAMLVNIIVCYYVARPVPGLGIVMPGFVPPLIAAGSAMLLAPQDAPAVAFVAGVMGPLIGADLLHLKTFVKSGMGMASIGGAGTFDGIVLSGIVAAYLA